MTPLQRNLLLYGLLAGSAALVGWDRLRGADHGIAGAVARDASSHGAHVALATSGGTNRASSSTPKPTLPLARVRGREPVDEDTSDAFAPLQPPSAPAPAVAVAQKPTVEAPPAAPELPFTVIGKQQQQGKWEVYLATSDEPIIARQGDVIAENYHVDRIEPPTMTLTYLPLHQSQTLQIGAPFNE